MSGTFEFVAREQVEEGALVAAGTPIKVVSERLGHAHPGFTMATYQHLLPSMGAAAARDFATLLATVARRRAGRSSTDQPSRHPRSQTWPSATR